MKDPKVHIAPFDGDNSTGCDELHHSPSICDLVGGDCALSQ